MSAIQMSLSFALIADAFVKAQTNISHAAKNSTNTEFAKDFADLAAVRDAAVPALNAEGIGVLQFPFRRDGRVFVTTRLLHSSGEWIESTCDAALARDDAQGLGSAITYLRRYCLAAICGVAQADDDGTAASARGAARAPTKTKDQEKTKNAGPLCRRYETAASADELKAANAEARLHWDEFTVDQRKKLTALKLAAVERLAPHNATTDQPMPHEVLVEKFSRAVDEASFFEAVEAFEAGIAEGVFNIDETRLVENAQELARERIEGTATPLQAEPSAVEA